MMPKDDGPVLVQPLALPVLRAKIPERGQVRSWLLRHTMDRLKEEKRGERGTR